MMVLHYNKNKVLTIPQTWDELSQKQYIKLIALLHKHGNSLEYGYDKALQILCGKNIFMFSLIPVDIRMAMHEHVGWVFETNGTVKQLIPKYKGLYGPAGEFDNLTMAEFHYCEIFFKQVIEGVEADALDNLCAVLYREGKNPKLYDYKRNRDGDLRIEYHSSDIAWHKKKVSKWPLPVKQSILYWYSACRQTLIENYEEAFEGSGSSENYFAGLYGMIRSLAGEKYGTFEQVEKMLVHNAFMEIIAAKKEAEELKRQRPQIA